MEATAPGVDTEGSGPEAAPPVGEAGTRATDVDDVDIEALRSDLDDAMTELEQLKDKFLRAKAEAENTRRRADNEIANVRKYAIDRFAAEMLIVRDSLELAKAVDLDEQDTTALETMLEGLELTLKQMDNVFEKFAIRVVAPEPGEKLDPERHQAMSIQESSDIEPNHILSVIQKGYTLQDRLIRPAMVIVAKAAEPAASEPPEQEKA
jgi:molecular chaperone GrpE